MLCKKIAIVVSFSCFIIHSLITILENYYSEATAINVEKSNLSAITFPVVLEIAVTPGLLIILY